MPALPICAPRRDSSLVTSSGSAARGRARPSIWRNAACGGARRSGLAADAYPKLVSYTTHAPTKLVERAERALAALSSERMPAAVASVAFDLYWARSCSGGVHAEALRAVGRARGPGRAGCAEERHPPHLFPLDR